MTQKKPLVLIVDDDRDIREAVCETLRDEGYDVALAEDGARALEILAERACDAVLLDVVMPRFDGRDFMQALQRLPSDVKARIPIILSTANAHPEELARELGTPHYVQKPFTLAGLLEVIGRAVSKSAP